MTNPDAVRRAAEILGALPTDAGSLAATTGASDKMREVLALNGPVVTAEARRAVEQAQRLLDSADKQSGALKGFMLAQAHADLALAIAEAGESTPAR
jgi:hypothetical protein